jgi:hypothetical protein
MTLASTGAKTIVAREPEAGSSRNAPSFIAYPLTWKETGIKENQHGTIVEMNPKRPDNEMHHRVADFGQVCLQYGLQTLDVKYLN